MLRKTLLTLFTCFLTVSLSAQTPDPDDLGLLDVPTLTESYFSSCFFDTLLVEALVLNAGSNSQNAFQVKYQLNNGPIAASSYANTLLAGDSVLVPFATPIVALIPGINQLTVWVELPGDTTSANDTLSFALTYDLSTLAFPFVEDFEQFPNCGTASDCELENCLLFNGWTNLTNGVGDDIDWRTDNNGTPSNGTGPFFDHNPGGFGGKYLYLEGSGDCFNREAIMVSSCIDLTGWVNPEFRFWYHMNGADIASLHLDVRTDSGWQNDVISPLVGAQGNNWVGSIVSLAAYAGEPIQLRFRGYTGNDFAGDIAIDDLSFSATPVNDLAALALVSPPQSYLSSCFFDSVLVEVAVENQGLDTINSVQAKYQLNLGTIVSQNFSLNLPAGTMDTLSFSVPVTNLFPAINLFNVWVEMPGDANQGNDSLAIFLEYNTTTLTLPINEDFESYGACGTASNCADELCSLGGGWINLQNGVDDEIDWRVDADGTPSNGTGPTIDHNPGTTVGQYIYLEGSGDCFSQEALMISACIDLVGIASPELSFWYHMQGVDIASLHLDVFDGSSWQNDVMIPLNGDQGPNWLNRLVDLSAYSGMQIQLRFRGYTGIDFAGDIALDDISLYNVSAGPVVNFSANATEICTGQSVSFTDESLLSPTTWNWSFSPNTVTYLGGTDSSSQSPIVQFNTNGVYNVSLTASNANGANTNMQTGLISVSDGIPLPFGEDFESFGLCGVQPNCEGEVCPLSNGWTNLVNLVEDDIDWRVDEDGTFSGGTGPNVDHNPGTNTGNYLYIEPSGDCDFQEAIMVSPCISLAGQSQPRMSFWYHMEGDNIGELHVDVLNGATWDLDVIPALIGEQDSVWLQAIVDLSAYVGTVIQVRFRGITGNDFQGDIAIDDLFFGPAPNLAFGLVPSACEGAQAVIVDSSNNPVGVNYLWDFGAGASPATSTTAGNQSVTWNSPGTKTVRLTVSNGVGSLTQTQTIVVDPLPTAGFQANSSNGYKFNFFNSTANALSYFWDFGDGNTSTNILPSHTYGNNGPYTITLIATNACGNDTLTQNVMVSNVVPPTALVAAVDTVLCVGEGYTFESQSFGIGISAYDWSFGTDANPTTANTVGPHTVSFQSAGMKMIILTVANGTGASSDTLMVDVEPLPQAAFADSLLPAQAVAFTNQSMDANSYQWDFGDGNGSTQAEPSYTYASGGVYTVTLVATNDCGSDTATVELTVISTGLEKDLNGIELTLSPNPNPGNFNLWLKGDRAGEMQLALVDLNGKELFQQHFFYPGGTHQEQIEAGKLARGVYLLKVQLATETVYRKVVIQ